MLWKRKNRENSKKGAVMKKKAFRCKHIYTAVSPELIDGYVIIEDNRIKFVGSADEGATLIDDETEVIDVSENFVMPGFNDFHVHLISAGLLEEDGVLRYMTSEEEAAEYLYNLNKGKDKRWIMGGAWDPLLWPGQKNPTKKSLDKYFPNTPVFLLNKECHGAWVNSATLDFFGITKDTPDPQDGMYSRFEDGEPDGYVHEQAAVAMQEEIFKNITDEELAEYGLTFIRSANQYGITSVGDVAGAAPVRPKGYKIIEDRGELTARIFFYPSFSTGVEEINNLKKEYCSGKLACRGVKTFIDGTPQGYSGYMLEDYSDRPGNKGVPLIPEETFIKQVCEYDKAGIQTRVHACGDAGARLCLDAIEEAQKQNGKKDLRHCVEHLESMASSDIKRFGELGVVASVQPEHLPKYDFYEHPFHKILGEERMKYSWPFESIRKSGGILAFGTDCPVVDISPYRGVFRAVTRLTNNLEPEGGWTPEQRLTIHDALRAYTWGGAYATGMDDKLGTLEEGKLADIAVVEKNLFECATDIKEMFEMRAVMTILDGEVVYKQ